MIFRFCITQEIFSNEVITVKLNWFSDKSSLWRHGTEFVFLSSPFYVSTSIIPVINGGFTYIEISTSAKDQDLFYLGLKYPYLILLFTITA